MVKSMLCRRLYVCVHATRERESEQIKPICQKSGIMMQPARRRRREHPPPPRLDDETIHGKPLTFFFYNHHEFPIEDDNDQLLLQLCSLVYIEPLSLTLAVVTIVRWFRFGDGQKKKNKKKNISNSECCIMYVCVYAYIAQPSPAHS